jgi:hypothetical protein
LRPKRNSRVSKSIWIVACSTHGRVPSALRTRVGQPFGQFIAGTWKTTSDTMLLPPSFAGSPDGRGEAEAPASSVLPQPITPTPSAKNARTDRNSLLMRSVSCKVEIPKC